MNGEIIVIAVIMGPNKIKNKRKLGFNFKARQQSIAVKDASTNELQVQIEIPGVSADSYDSSNALALPSRKRKKAEGEDVAAAKVRKLTKRERKKLEKIRAVKEKKAKRVELFAALEKLKASKEEVQLLTSISEVHSQRFKKRLTEKSDNDNRPPNVIRGSNRVKVSLSDDEDGNGEQSDVGSCNTSDISTDDEDKMETAMLDKTLTEHRQKAKADKSVATADGGGVKVDTEGVNDGKSNMRNAAENQTGDKSDHVPVEGLKAAKPAVNIPVNRTATIQANRKKLPIYGEEQQIVELINENNVTIVSGETGSGKTTQVPQFLYEAGYAHGGCIIGVTEPRRVAAISMAKRIAEEMNVTSREVSYQIRYEGNVTSDTKIKFMTDGVLLREIEQDFMLTKYSVIILDEAHERSVFTDILIGLLSRIVPFRIKKNMQPLKLVIMSATLDKVEFLANPRLFRTKPAEIDVAARQFPVDCHFAHKTPQDYLSAAFRKTCKIHQEQPPGGILVFVTGQQEVRTLVSKLRKAFPYDKDKVVGKADQQESRKQRKKRAEEAASILPDMDLSKYSAAPADMRGGDDTDLSHVDTADIDDFDLEDGEINHIDDEAVEITSTEPMWVLPLYSLLSSQKQNQVFEPPPFGCRLCVIATNVAETSLTIPNIHYVIDTGKTKTKFYDKVTGVSTFKVTWTSKASANQRMGRAGRVGKGKCFRLYSSAMYNDNFVEHAAPEITRRPVDDLVLQMKAMAITKVANFPFPTPPATEQILAAERLLVSLGALRPNPGSGDRNKKADPTYVITELGRTMAQFPVAPRYARMLAATDKKDLLPYVIIAVAALSVDELFEGEANAEKEDEGAKQKNQRIRALKKIWTNAGQSQLLGDLAMLIKAVGACETERMAPQFCTKNGLRYKAMTEIRKLRCQLTKEVNLCLSGVNVCVDPSLAPPTEEQMLQLRKIATSGLADHVAKLVPDPPPGVKDRHKNAYQCGELQDFVYIHPTSALFKQKKDFVVYQHIHQTSRQFMKGVVAIEPHWLPMLAPYHCHFSRPLEDPLPSWADDTGKVMCHMKVTFGGVGGWELGEMCLEYPALPERYAWFAQFFLKGSVVPGMAQFTPHLLSLPSTVVKPWARLQPRTEALKKALAVRGVDSRQTLLDEWEDNPKFLLNAFLQWVPESMHWEVSDKWPPLK